MNIDFKTSLYVLVMCIKDKEYTIDEVRNIFSTEIAESLEKKLKHFIDIYNNISEYSEIEVLEFHEYIKSNSELFKKDPQLESLKEVLVECKKADEKINEDLFFDIMKNLYDVTINEFIQNVQPDIYEAMRKRFNEILEEI